jgi:ribokinase
MASIRVIGIGALNVDFVYSAQNISSGGETSIEAAGRYPGGSAANTVYGLAKLGISTGFCGAVADDENGRILLDSFVSAGIDTSHIVIKYGEQTGSVFCMTSGQERLLYVMSGANGKLSGEDIDIDYLARSEWLHISSFVDDAQFGISRNVVSNLPDNVKVSFSPGVLYVQRGLSELQSFLRKTEIMFLNRSEIEQLTGLPFVEGSLACLEAGCSSVVVTLSQGVEIEGTCYIAYIVEKGRSTWVTSGVGDSGQVVDSTGAGDAFASGYLFGKLSGKTDLECGRYGHIAASSTLHWCGARRGLPSKIELLDSYVLFYPD